MVIVRLERIRQIGTNPITSLGFEPATFQLAAQCLNQVRHTNEYTVKSIFNESLERQKQKQTNSMV
jgi:hypothetical protein